MVIIWFSLIRTKIRWNQFQCGSLHFQLFLFDDNLLLCNLLWYSDPIKFHLYTLYTRSKLKLDVHQKYGTMCLRKKLLMIFFIYLWHNVHNPYTSCSVGMNRVLYHQSISLFFKLLHSLHQYMHNNSFLTVND